MKEQRLRYISYVLYAAFILILLISFFGSSKSGILNFTGEKTLQGTGLNKSKVDSLDDKIDESIYNMDIFTYRISKIREFFTGEGPVKPEKKKHEYITNGLYYPALNALIIMQRILFFFVSLFLLFTGVIFHLLYKIASFNARIKTLELILLQAK